MAVRGLGAGAVPGAGAAVDGIPQPGGGGGAGGAAGCDADAAGCGGLRDSGVGDGSERAAVDARGKRRRGGTCCTGSTRGSTGRRDGNHWIANERHKYIWFSQTGEEHLFDVVEDPNEERDLAPEADLGPWRGRLAEELAERPEGFSEGGGLVVGRPHGMFFRGRGEGRGKEELEGRKTGSPLRQAQGRLFDRLRAGSSASSGQALRGRRDGGGGLAGWVG